MWNALLVALVAIAGCGKSETAPANRMRKTADLHDAAPRASAEAVKPGCPLLETKINGAPVDLRHAYARHYPNAPGTYEVVRFEKPKTCEEILAGSRTVSAADVYFAVQVNPVTATATLQFGAARAEASLRVDKTPEDVGDTVAICVLERIHVSEGQGLNTVFPGKELSVLGLVEGTYCGSLPDPRR